MKLRVPESIIGESMNMMWYKESQENPCPEGEHNFLIVGTHLDEAQGRLSVFLISEDGYKVTDSNKLYLANGSYNESVWKRFAVFYNRATGDNLPRDGFDTDDLLGECITAVIEHQEKMTGDGFWINLGDMTNCEKFTPKEGVQIPKAQKTKVEEDDDVDFSTFIDELH